MKLYLGLVHYPVLNRNREVIASAITSIDLHDMARLSRTYDVSKCFIITPLQDQKELAMRLMKHWSEGIASITHPTRAEAIRTLSLVDSIEEAIEKIESAEKQKPQCWVTSARKRISEKTITFSQAREILFSSPEPILILFGTAWGLHESVFERADKILEPIRAKSSYNHLSVRCASAIILDRLIGEEIL